MAKRSDPAIIVWQEFDSAVELPKLADSLSGWTIDKKRRSHWNAHRAEGGSTYFLKWFYHHRLRSPAQVEWRNAQWLQRLEVPTVAVAGWGRHPRGSFVVFTGSPGYPANQWRERGLTAGRLAALARRFAGHIARLHHARLCHRDLNVYHVLIHGDSVRLIDVGRVRRFRRRRWLVHLVKPLTVSAVSSNFHESIKVPCQRSFGL